MDGKIRVIKRQAVFIVKSTRLRIVIRIAWAFRLRLTLPRAESSSLSMRINAKRREIQSKGNPFHSVDVIKLYTWCYFLFTSFARVKVGLTNSMALYRVCNVAPQKRAVVYMQSTNSYTSTWQAIPKISSDCKFTNTWLSYCYFFLKRMTRDVTHINQHSLICATMGLIQTRACLVWDLNAHGSEYLVRSNGIRFFLYLYMSIWSLVV